MYLGSLDGGLPICLDKFTANEEKNHVQNKNDYYLPKYIPTRKWQQFVYGIFFFSVASVEINQSFGDNYPDCFFERKLFLGNSILVYVSFFFVQNVGHNEKKMVSSKR